MQVTVRGRLAPKISTAAICQNALNRDQKAMTVYDFHQDSNVAGGNDNSADAAARRERPLISPPLALEQVEQDRRSRASLATKRCLDIIISLTATVFLLPAIIGIALVIFLSDGRPILYRQKRVGRNGKEFACFKFRSMARDADARLRRLLDAHPELRAEWERNQKLAVDPRVHRIGGILRQSSLDELPQLINILRGEMSLVGPRPIVPNEIERFGPNFADYKKVRPGLTGLWQVSGRSQTTYAERVALDTQYVNNRSTKVDIAIIMKTVVVVWKGVGSY